jgi:hypothetical protein
VLYLVSSTQAGTNTTNLDQVYIEGGAMVGSVTNNRGVLVKTMQGTNQAAFVATGLTSSNRVHLLLGNYTLPTGAWGIYSGLSDASYLQGNLLLANATDDGVNKLQVTGAAKVTGQLTLGSTITNGTYTYTLPSATGTLALTSQIPTVSGTTNYISKFTGSTTLGNSLVYDDGTNVGISTNNPLYKLESVKDITYADNIVNGDAQFSVAGSTTRTKRMTFGYDTNSSNGFGFIKTGNQGIAYTPLYLNPSASGLAGGISIGYQPSAVTPPASGLVIQGNTIIGTTTDAGYKLDVNGTGRFANTITVTGTSNSKINLYSNFSGGNVGMSFFNTSNVENIYFNSANGSINCTGPVNGGAATFSSSVTATQFNAFNDRNYLARGSFRLTSSTNNASALDISVGDNTTYINGNYYGGGNDNTIIIGTYANLSNQLVLKPSGNVLIGTTTDNSGKLQVNGQAQANEFFSTTTLISIPSSATTIFTSTGLGGVWLVSYNVAGNPSQVGYAIVGNAFGSTLTLLASAAGSQTALSISGLNLQLSQSAGGSINTRVNVIKLATTYG